MTNEEKNEMYRKKQEKQIKSRRTKIISLIVIPLVGVALTFILGFIGDNRQNEIKSATVLGSMKIGEYLDKNENGSAIYTGTIEAVNPVSILEEKGEYIMLHRKVEREEKIYDKDKEKYDINTKTISDDFDTCAEIKIDDVVVRYKSFHDLPIYTDTRYEGADINRLNTEFSYTPAKLDGTFFLKCQDGKVTSATYFESEDVAGESKKGFTAVKIIIWALIIVIEVCLVVSVVKTSKAIKIIGEKYQ